MMANTKKVVKAKAVSANVTALKTKKDALAKIKAEVKTLTAAVKAEKAKAKADRTAAKIAKAKAALDKLMNPGIAAVKRAAKKPGPVTVTKPATATATA